MDERMIKSPKHYTEGRRFEPKDVIRDWDLNFNLGNAVKYLARAGRKGDMVEDLKKAQQYIQFEIDALAAEGGEKAPCDKEAVDPFASLVRMLETEVKPIMVKIPEGVDVDKVLADIKAGKGFAGLEIVEPEPTEFQKKAVKLYNAYLYRLSEIAKEMQEKRKSTPPMLGMYSKVIQEIVLRQDFDPEEVLDHMADKLMQEGFLR